MWLHYLQHCHYIMHWIYNKLTITSRHIICCNAVYPWFSLLITQGSYTTKITTSHLLAIKSYCAWNTSAFSCKIDSPLWCSKVLYFLLYLASTVLCTTMHIHRLAFKSMGPWIELQIDFYLSKSFLPNFLHSLFPKLFTAKVSYYMV